MNPVSTRWLLASFVVPLAVIAQTTSVPPILSFTNLNLLAPRHVLPPDGTVKVSLLADKTEFFIGENILLHYRIEALTDAGVGVDTGGDYRGGNRAFRFVVKAVSASGTEATDPYPSQMNMGGLGGGGSAKQGKPWFEDVPLLRYRSLDQPGEYTITVFHDLGWGERQPNDPRVQTIKLKLNEPTEADARRLLAEFDQAKGYAGKSWGEKGRSTPDYTLLKHPAYIPVLEERAAKGDTTSLVGLASIPTPEATQTLIRLMTAESSTVGALAAGALRMRWPHPASNLPNYQPYVWPWRPLPLYNLQRPATNTWREEFYAEARTNALKLLATDWSDAVAGTAGLLAIYSINKEPDPLIAALDRQLERFRKDGDVGPKEGPRWASGYLMRALEEKANFHATMPEQPKTPGELMGFLVGVSHHPNFSPVGWETTFERSLNHELAVIREAALQRLPRPLPERMHPWVIQRLSDSDAGVRNAAFTRASSLKLPGGGELGLKAISTSSDFMLLSYATTLAVRDGMRVECAELLARRVADTASDPKYGCATVLGKLYELTLEGGVSGSYEFLGQTNAQAVATSLRDEWLKVIRHHTEELRAGRKLVMGQGLVTTNLIPLGLSYSPPRK